METTQSTQLQQYRPALYASCDQVGDATCEWLAALTSPTNARSVAELRLEAVFRREYRSVYHALSAFFDPGEGDAEGPTRREQEIEQLRLLGSSVPAPEKRRDWWFATDATSKRRQCAHTRQDRGDVYWPNSVAGHQPVTIGHRYSVLGALPEKAEGAPPWGVPLLTRRITTTETETEVAAAHLEVVCGDEIMLWHGALVVQGLDSQHSIAADLHSAAEHANLVTIARVRSNRVVHQQYQPPPGERKPGKPRS